MKLTHIKRSVAAVAIGAATGLLAGCGGGDAPDPTRAVPASASESSDGFVAYLLSLFEAADDAETLEPVPLEGFEPPTPEDTEPEPIS